MTRLGKIFVVFTAVMSLVFLAFIGVTTLGGPNWQLRADELRDYGFTKNVTETGVTWSVTRRVAADDKKALKTTDSLPAAIVAAQQDRLAVQTERLREVDEQIAAIKQVSEAESAARVRDEPGIARRVEDLRREITRLDAEVVALTKEGTRQADAVIQTRDVVEARRQDIARLSAELALVRTDEYQIEEQTRRLQILLVRLEGLIERATRRQQQLEAREDGTAS